MELTYLEKLFLSAIVIRSDDSGLSRINNANLSKYLNAKITVFQNNGRLLSSNRLNSIIKKIEPAVFQINFDVASSLDLSFTKREYEEFHHKIYGCLSHTEYLELVTDQKEREAKRIEEEGRRVSLDAERVENRRAAELAAMVEAERKREEIIKKAKIDQSLEYDRIVSSINEECTDEEKELYEAISYEKISQLFWHYDFCKSHLGQTKMNYFSSLCILAAQETESVFINNDCIVFKNNDPSTFVRSFLNISLLFNFENEKVKSLLRGFEKYHELNPSQLIYNEASHYWNRSIKNGKEGLESLRIFFFKGIVAGEWYFSETKRHLEERKPFVAPSQPSNANVINFNDWKAKKRA